MKLIDILKTNADSAKSYIENIIADRIEQKQDKLTFDITPTADSQNPVTSDGIKKAIDAKTVDLSSYYTKTETDTALAKKQDSLTFDSAPTANSTNPVTSGGVSTAMDAKANKTGDNASGTWNIDIKGKAYNIPTEDVGGNIWIS